MHGHHARPVVTRFDPASTTRPPPDGQPGPGLSLRARVTTRLHRWVLAHRAIEFTPTRIPDGPGPGEECLLLVHIRQVVGRVHYRICTDCAQGVINTITIDDRFQRTGLGTRALSHLRFCHPGITWHSTLSLRTTRELLRRMPIPVVPDTPCPHAHRPPPDPARATTWCREDSTRASATRPREN
ncbi:GNAT family N-acetyltransferase [Streptomyces sp. NPDC048269]|uniref:GNAT family N-acetyltransferase n=1 Tax=Streptomyces sp. NPDC048269 TaxID=3155753 RepID=UPI003442DA21